MYTIQPLQDRRWSELVDNHPRSSIFHTTGWLNALHRTYGYEPLAYTTSSPGACLENGLVFCRVKSSITGQRLVSLPFSDHSDPLVEYGQDLESIIEAATHDVHSNGLNYLEIRPLKVLGAAETSLQQSDTFCFHCLNLRPSLDALLRGFHKDCVQRKIRRAEREGLGRTQGRSEAMLANFYRLMVKTRRRHGLLPQPFAWFRNLVACIGDKINIQLAIQNDRPIAGILTLRHRDTLVYKYGCSEGKSSLGSMHLLLWEAIKDAKRDGLVEFDLGRSDWADEGLITFKDRWNAARSTLTYLRFPAGSITDSRYRRVAAVAAARICSHAPLMLLRAAGQFLYKHVG